MRINHNIAALNTHRQLGTANANQSKSMEKLSSGLRINRAGDDAAGLAISEKMRAQVRGLDQASSNAQDGISLIQTAEGALSETHSILQRMRELATQAANDTNVGVDRNEIQKEINQLSSEINRVGNTTEFNTQSLLKGGSGSASVASTGLVTSSTLGTTGTNAVKGTAPVKTQATTTATIKDLTQAGANGKTLSLDVGGKTFTVTIDQAQNAADANNISANGQIITLGTADAADADGSAAALKDILNQAFAKAGLDSQYVASSNAAELKISAKAGSDADGTAGLLTGFTVDTNVGTDDALTLGTVTAGKKALSAEIDLASLDDEDKIKALAGKGFTIGDQTIEFFDGAKGNYNGNGVAVDIAGLDDADKLVKALVSQTAGKLDGVTIKAGATADTFQFEAVQSGTAGNDIKFSDGGVSKKFEATFQVGANTGQSMTIEIDDMRSQALKVTGNEAGSITAKNGQVASYVQVASVSNGTNNTSVEFALDVSSHDKATAAISVINDAIEKVSAQRSNLGAYQNRLDHTINNLGTSSENLTAAESRVRDVDMAKEMMNQTRESILAQASQAMLAQANQKPQSVLQLLQ